MDFTRFKSQCPVALDPQQEAAVRTVDGPVLLLAVPGSGKTTVLVARLGYMRYVCGIPPESILTMTYTVAAARDMRERFAAFFGREEAERLAFHTINGVCSRIIRRYERVTGGRAFALLEDGGEKSALLAALYRDQCQEFAAESTVKALQTAITYAKNQMLKGEELARIETEGVDFPSFYKAYNDALRERRRMDYDDQMVYALRILRQYPEILQAVRRRYRYFCVDEAQDTSRIQHAILRLLAGESGNLFLVGDEDQSIYGFRAAYPQALTQFDTAYPGAKVLRMEQNYRSARPIVEAADAFIQKNTQRRPKHMRAVRGDGAPIREISVYDRAGQYRYLCKLAEDCRTETAVLYRDNDSALPLIDLLDRAGLPYRCRQNESLFFTNRVVRDITDIIRFAQNPQDGELFLNLYYKLGAGISRGMAQEAASRAGQAGTTLLDYVAGLPAASAWTQKQCRALQTHLAHLLEEPAGKAVYRIVHFMGYGAYLEDRGGDLHKAEILQALGDAEPTPARLLERLEELQEVVRRGSDRPEHPFILSTIHSSKGLEYQRVILMDVADGLLPKILPGKDPAPEERDAYEEERRVFYVAMTRAREELGIVTFRREGLASSFSREVFPPKERKPTLGRKLRTARSQDVRQAEAQSRHYVPGCPVLHKTFGHGILVSRIGDIGVVAFDSGTVKKISIATALRSGQLHRG